MGILAPRQFYGNSYRCNYYGYNCHSNWYRWGRWVLAGVLILLGILAILFFLFCARRRRSRSRRNQASAPMVNQPPIGGYGNAGFYNEGYNANQTYNAPSGPPPPNYGHEYYGQQAGVTQPGQTYQPYK